MFLKIGISFQEFFKSQKHHSPVTKFVNLFQNDSQPFRVSPTEVYVASAQKNLLQKRMELCGKLWDAGIRAEFSYKANPKMLSQLQYCEERQIPWTLIVGERELEQGCVKLRNVVTREEQVSNFY